MTHENQSGIEVLVILLYIVRIIFGRLPLVHRIEIEARVVVLDGLEESFEGILEAALVRYSAVGGRSNVGRRAYHFGSICSGGVNLSSFSPCLLFSSMSRCV